MITVYCGHAQIDVWDEAAKALDLHNGDRVQIEMLDLIEAGNKAANAADEFKAAIRHMKDTAP